MARDQAWGRLAATVPNSRITVLHGLPRVGRSTLLAQWCEEQSGLQRVTVADIATCTALIQVLDHLSAPGAAAFIDAFRLIEAERLTRFVISPLDLGARRQLQEQLSGAVQLVALDPLQRHELRSEELAMAEPSGPEANLEPVETTTNRPGFEADRHWLRGGLPESYEAASDAASLRMRRDLIDGLMLRDYAPQGIGPDIQMMDYLTWVANQNGGEFDLVDPPFGKKAEAKSAIYVLDQLGVVRILRNYPAGSTTALSLKPKIHIRDSGLLHAVLGIETVAQLRSHSIMGESFEGYAIETLIAASNRPEAAQFYRKDGPEGADEIDLILDFRPHNGKLVAIECKTSPGEPPRPGFYRAMNAIGATHGFVVHSGSESILTYTTHRLDLDSARARVIELAR